MTDIHTVVELLAKQARELQELRKDVDILMQKKESKRPMIESKNEVQRITGYYSVKYKEEIGIPYMPNFGADSKAIKKLLEQVNEDKLKQIIDLYFERRKDPSFIWGKATPTILNFAKRFNEVLDV